MKIEADVKSISKLKDYFFLVPDYQREYVWNPEDQVEQFLIDIENEFQPGITEQNNYFIGSIIIVKNGDKYDVVDGQQRLTTIMLSLCAIRDLFKTQISDDKQKKYLQNIEELLCDFDMESDKTQVRLELQYEESRDYLDKLIQAQPYEDTEKTGSIIRMQEAYSKIYSYLRSYISESIDKLLEFAKYFLTKIELVVIESEDLSSALKIFETINQRGASLNAMDLVKNLLFSQAKESEFDSIKTIWKEITNNLQRCKEDQKPLRFLRYFLMARYYNGILREDDIYKWIISSEGKNAIKYETHPLELAKELKYISKRYADLVEATECMKDGHIYSNTTNIGLVNKYKSRQHLIMLLALKVDCDLSVIEYLAKQIESFFFYTATLRIQAKSNESRFVSWAEQLRGLDSIPAVSEVIENKMLPYLKEKVAQFKQEFLILNQFVYNPQYRLRYVLGKIENTILQKSNLPQQGHNFFNSLQIEHILPQTPKNGFIPDNYNDKEDYYNYTYLLGNITLLEGTINQAVNNCNDLSTEKWFEKKQHEYDHSAVVSTKLLDHNYSIGLDTALNRFKNDKQYSFVNWNKSSIEKRQSILLELAFDTWRINDRRIDA